MQVVDIDGFKGLYTVDNHGRIRCLTNGHEVEPSVGRSGYSRVSLLKNGSRNSCSVHRIVAAAFCENPHARNMVNHKDFNKSNNSATNLEWVNHLENIRHAARAHGRRGIVANKRHDRWTASITIEGVRYPLGSYKNKNMAVMRYWHTFIEWHGFAPWDESLNKFTDDELGPDIVLKVKEALGMTKRGGHLRPTKNCYISGYQKDGHFEAWVRAGLAARSRIHERYQYEITATGIRKVMGNRGIFHISEKIRDFKKFRAKITGL